MKITSLNKLFAKGARLPDGQGSASGGKKLIVFDLDGTLAPTKSVMDREMSRLIKALLTAKKVAVIGGGKYQLFKEQFINELAVPKALLKNLFLFPTTSTAFYRYQNGWKL